MFQSVSQKNKKDEDRYILKVVLPSITEVPHSALSD